IDLLPSPDFGFATVDPKYETHLRTLFRLNNRHAHLVKTDPQAAKDLRRDIVIIDFGSRNPVSSYNILVRWPNVDPDFFAASRAELLLDLFPSSDRLSLGGSALLQRSILMLSEFNLPITYLTMFLSDPVFRTRLLAKSKHQDVSEYFARRFEQVPAPTVAALIRRIDDLTVSESVRLALSGDSAPDFRRFQDEGKI